MHRSTVLAVLAAAALAAGGSAAGLVATGGTPAASVTSAPAPLHAHPRDPAASRPAPGLRVFPATPTALPSPSPVPVLPPATAARPAHTPPPPSVVHAPVPASYPSTLSRVPSSAGQAITVTASGYGTTTAVLEAWTRSASGWTRSFGPWTANLGYTGLARPGAKHEGDGHTPSGVYGFSYLFGIEPNPGVAYSYRQVTGSYDVWDDDPSSPLYNEWVDTRQANAGASPEPMDNAPSYLYGAVIAYNTARTPGLGSAIFLHVTKGGSTAGCVAIPEGDLVPLLRWMRPGAVISIGVG